MLDVELDNIRTALEWARFTGQVDEGSRLACGFAMLFVVRGRQHELLTRLRHLLHGVHTLPPTLDIAQAYNWLADLQIRQGDWTAAETSTRTALEIGMTLADPEIQSRAAWHLSSCTLNQGRFDEAHAWTEHALTLGKFDPDTAADNRLEFSTFLGLYQGDYASAVNSGRETYQRTTSKVSTNKVQTSGVARVFGYALAHTGALHEAHERLRESLVDNHALGDELAVTASLSAFATLANAQDNPKRAVTLLSASEVLRLPLHAMLLPIDTLMAKRAAAVARGSLTDDEWQISWAAGQRMNLAEAMAYALQV